MSKKGSEGILANQALILRKDPVFDDEGEKQFHVLYQPLVDLNTGGVAGFSARPFSDVSGLDVRFHEEFGPSGLSREQSCAKRMCVANQAMSGLAEWLASGEGPGVIMVNLDPWGKDHCGKGPLERMPLLLAEHKVPPSRLMAFFHVDSLMEHPADALDLGIGLKRLGVGVGVDNLDPAAAPFNFLEMFPADLLRMRLNEIAGYGEEDELASWLPGLCVFADNLLMEVVVEGVESARQYKLIKSLGCRYAQGGYFSRPLAIDRALEFVRSTGVSPYLLGG